MEYDRFSSDSPGVDCIMLTLNAERHLVETLDAFYREVPISRLLVIDGGSKDNTIRLLMRYPRVNLQIRKGMTTGKAWELLKDMVSTPWFIWIDVGKIPASGWYDRMTLEKGKGDLLGSLRYNLKDGLMTLDPIIQNPFNRLLGGPWLIRTSSIGCYHVDDDYAQRNIDIIIRRQLEEHGGRYHLVTSTSHICHLPDPVTDEEELQRRHTQNAMGIVKYITPEYAKNHANYLLNDHWMLMMHQLPQDFIQKTNPAWLPVLKQWRIRRLLIAKTTRLLYGYYKKVMKK